MFLKRRFTALYLTLTFLCLCSPQSVAHAQSLTSTPCDKFDVMTRNMYVGTDFGEIFAAQDTQTLLVEVAEAFGEVQASNVHARIEAIAHEIKTTKPDLISLQEVALWQTGPFDPTTPSANTVVFDYLALLLDELNKNNSLQYEAVAVLTNLVAEAPAIGPDRTLRRPVYRPHSVAGAHRSHEQRFCCHKCRRPTLLHDSVSADPHTRGGDDPTWVYLGRHRALWPVITFRYRTFGVV